MPWCPKCGVEYEAGRETCNGCGESLVEELGLESSFETDQEAFLKNVSNTEADIIKGLLNTYGIPIRKRYREASGSYINIYMGRADSGVDIFVPESKLQEARNVLQAEYDGPADTTADTGRVTDEGARNEQKRRVMTWIMLLILILPTILGLFMWLIRFFANL